MAEDYWPLAQQILEKVAEREKLGDECSLADIIYEIGGDPHQLERQARALYQAGYIEGGVVESLDGDFDLLSPRLRPKGMRRVGEWPSEDGYSELLKVLDAKLSEAEEGSDEKGRLQRLKDSVTGIGRDVAVGVLTEWVKRGGSF